MRLQKFEVPDPYKGMGRVEKFISKLAPNWALKRQYNKLRLAQSVRAYESVEISRLRRQRQDARSADQINNVSVDKLRYQSRYLDENHDLARSVLNTLVSQVVGTGLLTFPMVKNEAGELMDDINQRLETLWADWTNTPEVTFENDWGKVQRLACRSWFRDGEVFAQLVRGDVPRLDHGTQVMFSLEQLEADLCPVGLNDASQLIRQGIKKNVWGRPNTYYFYKNYPSEGAGDSIITGIPVNLSFTTLENVKGIIAQNVVHLKHTDRIRQTRGVPIFASVFTRLDDLKDYEESERMAARIGAAFAFAITKNIDYTGSDTPDPNRFRELDLAPGIIADNLQPGETIESLKNERPDNKITDFRSNQLKAIAGGVNAGYSSIAKDYEGSYSSQRQELVEQSRVYKQLRDEFVRAYIHPIYRAFVEVSRDQGLIDLRGADPLTVFDAEHVGLGTPYIEPQRESEAAIKQVQAGFKSKAQVILEQGGNPREVTKQIAAEREKDNAEGLVFSSDYANDIATSSVGSNGDSNSDGATNVEQDTPADDEAADEESADRAYVLGNVYEGPDGQVYRYTTEGFIKVA
jgi:lambda family phage portal protein